MDQQVSWTVIRLYLSAEDDYLSEEEIAASTVRILNEESPQQREIKYEMRKSFNETTYLSFNAPYPNLNDLHILSTETDGKGLTRTLYETTFTLLCQGKSLSFDCLLALYDGPPLEDRLLKLERITCGDTEYLPIYSPQMPPVIVHVEVGPSSLRPLT